MRHPLSRLPLPAHGLWLAMLLTLAGPLPSLAQEPATANAAAPQTPVENPETEKPPSLVAPTRSQVQELSLERRLPATQQRRLDIGAQAFLGLYLPAARPQPRGGVILIADREEHADWPTLIGPARRQLSAAGWHTLAISLPEHESPEHGLEEGEHLRRDSVYREQTLARIQAARQVLIAEGGNQHLPIVLLGRGDGAFWALSAAMAAEADSPLAAALILQGLRQTTEGDITTKHLLEQWSGPTYDILMSRPEQAEARRQQAKRLGHDRYRQLLWPQGEISELQQQILIKRLDGWLQRVLSESPDSA